MPERVLGVSEQAPLDLGPQQRTQARRLTCEGRSTRGGGRAPEAERLLVGVLDGDGRPGAHIVGPLRRQPRSTRRFLATVAASCRSTTRAVSSPAPDRPGPGSRRSRHAGAARRARRRSSAPAPWSLKVRYQRNWCCRRARAGMRAGRPGQMRHGRWSIQPRRPDRLAAARNRPCLSPAAVARAIGACDEHRSMPPGLGRSQPATRQSHRKTGCSGGILITSRGTAGRTTGR